MEKYRGDAKPRFFFYRDGEVMEAVEGVNAPSISRCARRAVATADGGPLRALPSPAQVLRGVLPRGHGGGGGGGGGRGRRRGGRLSGAGLNLVMGWRMVLRRGRTLRALLVCARHTAACVRARLLWRRRRLIPGACLGANLAPVLCTPQLCQKRADITKKQRESERGRAPTALF